MKICYILVDFTVFLYVLLLNWLIYYGLKVNENLQILAALLYAYFQVLPKMYYVSRPVMSPNWERCLCIGCDRGGSISTAKLRIKRLYSTLARECHSNISEDCCDWKLLYIASAWNLLLFLLNPVKI